MSSKKEKDDNVGQLEKGKKPAQINPFQFYFECKIPKKLDLDVLLRQYPIIISFH